MMPRSLFFVALAVFSPICSRAGELILEPSPFTITQSLTATVLPEKNTTAIPASPIIWGDWLILSISPHGARVAKGDVLIEFVSDSLAEKIEDTKRSIATQSLILAQAEQDLAHLKTTASHKIDALRTAADTAKEELEYFSKTRRDADERSADQSLDRAKQFLANQQEELRQLQKMYEADDLTDDTEEIILTRQQNAVTAATFALEMETLRHQRTRKVLLPREAVTLENQKRDADLALDEATKSIPRSIQQKSTDVMGLSDTLEREKKNLADLQKDFTLMKIQAPQDGWFFHGIIENGRWTTGETVKSLVPGGRPPTSRPFATFIPERSAIALFALTDDTTARAITSGQSGKITLPGREDIDANATVASISSHPFTDGKHTIVLHADWPANSSPPIGTTATVRIISYHKDSTFSIPTKALHFGKEGYSVSVKLADGKTEPRPVQRGRTSGDQVEILSGLDRGQVIILPES